MFAVHFQTAPLAAARADALQQILDHASRRFTFDGADIPLSQAFGICSQEKRGQSLCLGLSDIDQRCAHQDGGRQAGRVPCTRGKHSFVKIVHIEVS